jgi:bifunctional non-homologous end joining protein LigD
MAIHVDDHPISYSTFKGTIPPTQCGAGIVIVWDNGAWGPVGDPRAELAAGKLVFRMHGKKLEGLWELLKIAKGGERQEPWLLFKKTDEFARAREDYGVVMALPDSVIAKPLRKAASPAGSKPLAKKAAGVMNAGPARAQARPSFMLKRNLAAGYRLIDTSATLPVVVL